MVRGKQVSKSGVFSVDGESVIIDGTDCTHFELHLTNSVGKGINGSSRTVSRKEFDEILEKGEIIFNIGSGKNKKEKRLKLNERNKKQIRAQLRI